MLDGVCGGIAEYFGIDPTVVRLIWALFSLMGGCGILAYIIAAVIIVSLTAPHDGDSPNAKKLLLRTLKDVVTNPIILGIAVGMLWSVLHIPQPTILQKSVSYLGNMATPLALIALGASFRLENAKGKLGLTLGISAAKLIAILVMLGSATTCSCFVMAKNMKHDGTITACAVMMTTLLSAFSLTMWLFVMKSLGYI